jgi:predicted O-methyltransferase YrrM
MPGFSSHFSAVVGTGFLRWQSGAGVKGDLAEIGVFLGRSFIALALAMEPDEKCVGIDKFTWPDNAMARFKDYCGRFGVRDEALIACAVDTQTLAPNQFRKLGGRNYRYIHIDGDHSPPCLKHDLSLAIGAISEGGVICLDDMLHPLYPELAVTVHKFLSEHSAYRVFCIIDREDAVAATKYMICHERDVERYRAAARDLFPQYVFPGDGEFSNSRAVILSLDTAVIPFYNKLNFS